MAKMTSKTIAERIAKLHNYDKVASYTKEVDRFTTLFLNGRDVIMAEGVAGKNVFAVVKEINIATGESMITEGYILPIEETTE